MTNEIKLKPIFLADSLTEKSAFADVQKAVEQLKSCIQGWHEQDKESITQDEWVVKDWNFVHYVLIMEDGSWRIANAFLDDDPEQGRDYYLRFQDTNEYVDTNQINMWCRLPSDDPAFI